MSSPILAFKDYTTLDSRLSLHSTGAAVMREGRLYYLVTEEKSLFLSERAWQCLKALILTIPKLIISRLSLSSVYALWEDVFSGRKISSYYTAEDTLHPSFKNSVEKAREDLFKKLEEGLKPEQAPTGIQLDKEFLLSAIKKDWSFFNSASQELQADKDIQRAYRISMSDTVKSSLVPTKQDTNATMMVKLSEAFNLLKTLKLTSKCEILEVNNLYASILSLYGMKVYSTNFEHALFCLTVAFQLQLYDMQQLDKLYLDPRNMDIDDYKKSSESFAVCFNAIDQYINHKQFKNNLERIIKFKSEDANFEMASTLRWMGHSLQNLDQYAPENQDNFNRLKAIYTTCEAILNSSQTRRNQLEYAELIYNAFGSLHLWECKLHHQILTESDVKDACDILDEAKVYNFTLSFQARVANLKACYYHKIDNEKRLIHLNESANLWKQTLDQEKDLSASEKANREFLVANVHNNILASLFDEKEVSVHEFKKHIAYVYDYFSKCEKEGKFHSYCMTHMLNCARFEMDQGNKEAALKALDNVEKVAKMHETAEMTAEIRRKASELREKITG
jgi:hypothetical protein